MARSKRVNPDAVHGDMSRSGLMFGFLVVSLRRGRDIGIGGRRALLVDSVGIAAASAGEQ